MARKRKMPKDFAVDALAIAAVKQHTSYGRLVAATTREQRADIAERYRANYYRQSASKQEVDS